MLAAPERTAEQTLAALTEQPDAARSYRSLEGSYRSAVQARGRRELPAGNTRSSRRCWMRSAGNIGAADELTPGEAQLVRCAFWSRSGRCGDSGGLPLDDLVKDTTYQTATLTALTLRYYGLPARYAEASVLTQGEPRREPRPAER